METTKTFKKVLGGGMAAAALAGAGIAIQAPAASAASDWDRLAECESGGNWSINTGNGYYGGIQFSQQSWQAVGGSGLPSEASKEEQIQRGEKLRQIQGWGAWPSCSAQLGLSGSPSGTPSASSNDTTPAQTETSSAPAETQTEAPAETEEAPAAPAETQTEAPAETQAPAPAPAPAQTEAPATSEVEVSDETYTVVEGDSLSKIANELGIDNWEDLYSANADILDDPNVIYVGDELKLPVL